MESFPAAAVGRARRLVERRAGRVPDVVLLGSFACATFAGASLVFLVQPVAARMLLPLFGGSASVWLTAIVFFQAVLLAGYVFAHVSTSLLGPSRQRVAQIGVLLLPLVSLPIGQGLSPPPPGTAPEWWLLGMLAVGVGLPFFAVTTASPVLQRWFSATRHRSAGDPYFLYAAGNAGSLAALVAYPFLLEPRLTLDQQADLWSLAYLVFAGLSVVCALLLARGVPAEIAGPARAAPAAPLSWMTRGRWIVMAFVPSSLMLGATAHISTDIAAVPLVWIGPLAVYLLTFVIAFSRNPLVSPRRAAQLLAVTVAVLVPSLLGALTLPVWSLIAVHVALVFAAGLLAHGRLAAERPPPARLTEFYVLLSIGGVLGGVFNALLAPLAFDSVLEYPLVMVLALLLRPGSRRSQARTILGRTADLWIPCAFLCLLLASLVVLGADRAHEVVVVAAAASLLFVRRPVRFALTTAALLSLSLVTQAAIHADRTFYGVLRVIEDDDRRSLVHGRTVHGAQNTAPGESSEPLSYYGRRGPIGEVFASLQHRRPFERVSVIGLGVGALAAYGREAQQFTFYELDPAVADIASDERYFTFLRDSRAGISVVIGDGRRALAGAPRASSNLVVVDAFSSDAIPVHLLTIEALDLYFEKLRPGGVVVFHTSNRYLDLAPVLAAAADESGLAALERRDRVPADRAGEGFEDSRWVALARESSSLAPLLGHGWQPLEPSSVRPWTDDFSNIVSVIDWS